MSKKGKLGFINKLGKTVIPLQYDNAGNFESDLADEVVAKVEKDGETSYINQQNKRVDLTTISF